MNHVRDEIRVRTPAVSRETRRSAGNPCGTGTSRGMPARRRGGRRTGLGVCARDVRWRLACGWRATAARGRGVPTACRSSRTAFAASLGRHTRCGPNHRGKSFRSYSVFTPVFDRRRTVHILHVHSQITHYTKLTSETIRHAEQCLATGKTRLVREIYRRRRSSSPGTYYYYQT